MRKQFAQIAKLVGDSTNRKNSLCRFAITSAIRGGQPRARLVGKRAPGRCAHVPTNKNNCSPGLSYKLPRATLSY